MMKLMLVLLVRELEREWEENETLVEVTGVPKRRSVCSSVPSRLHNWRRGRESGRVCVCVLCVCVCVCVCVYM